MLLQRFLDPVPSFVLGSPRSPCFAQNCAGEGLLAFYSDDRNHRWRKGVSLIVAATENRNCEHRERVRKKGSRVKQAQCFLDLRLR